MPNFGLSSARAEASRRNGAKSRGPKTPEGKARSAQNALKHGLRAQHFVVLGDEDLAAFDALEAALMAELAPQGALQAVLARRIVAASWRLERAERIEAELFARNTWDTTSFGLGMIRDCNGARAFDTLLRYRGGTLAELWRALRTLKALQAEARAAAGAEAPAPGPVGGDATRKGLGPLSPTGGVTGPNPFLALAPARTAQPDEPEHRNNPCDSDRASDRADRGRGEPDPAPAWPPTPLPALGGPAPCAPPIEPETRRQLAESAPPPAGEIAKNGSASLLAGTALVPACRRRA